MLIKKHKLLTLILFATLFSISNGEEEKKGVITFASGSYIKRKNIDSKEFKNKGDNNPLKEVYIWHDGNEIINTQEHTLKENTEKTTKKNHGLRARAKGTIAINEGKMLITPTSDGILHNSSLENEEKIENFDNHVFGALAYDQATILNKGEIELTALDQNTGTQQVGMGAYTGGQVINSGKISGSADTGIYVKGENALGINTGEIIHTGNNGMMVDGVSQIINKGTIANIGETGMKAINGGIAINTVDGIIENKIIATDKYSGKYGMFARGANSEVINDGIIRNEENSGLRIEDGALGINNNLIQNGGQGGITVVGKNSLGINNGTIENKKRNGIIASDGATGINNGTIKTQADFGMQASGKGSIAINQRNARIENTGNRGLVGSSYGVAYNEGIIDNGNGSSLFAENYGLVINGKNGEVISKGENGIHVKALGMGVNQGRISNKNNNGALVTAGGTFINEVSGVINNQGNFGIYVGAETEAETNDINAFAINKGTISNNGKIGVYVRTGSSKEKGISSKRPSYFINKESGTIENSGDVGVQVQGHLEDNNFDVKSYAINEGTIKNSGTIGMRASNGVLINEVSGRIENVNKKQNYTYMQGENDSIIRNYGTINVEGDNSKGIYVKSQSIAENFGSIVIKGDNGKGMYAQNATIINKGTIKLEGNNGVGMHAIGSDARIENTGTIILKDDQQITGNKENQKDSSGNSAILLGKGASFINSGNFKVEGDLDFSTMGDGKFEISKGGTIEADSIKGNFYASGALTLGSYDDTYSTYRALKTDKIDGEIKSNSAMFTSKLTDKNEYGYYDIIMERKNFNEILNNSSIANALENSYTQGTSNAKKDKLFDGLKLLQTEQELNDATEMTYGNKIYPTIRQQSFDFIKLNNEKIKSNVLSQTNVTNDIRYIGGVDYSIIDQDSSNNLTGYITKAKGIYLGADKNISKSYRIGGIVNITDINSNFTNNDRREDRMYQGTIYGIYDKGNTNLTSTLFLGKLDGKLNRNINFSTINENMKADIDNTYFGFTNQLTYKIDLNHFYLKPKVEANFISLKQDEINETGEYGLNIKKEKNKSFEGGIGLEIGKDINFDNGVKLSLNQGITYKHEFADTTKSIDAQLKDVISDRIKLSENDREKDLTELVTKIEVTKNDFGIYGEYRHKIGGKQDSQVTTLGITYKF